MESVARRALARLLTMQELGSGDDKDVTTTVSHVTAAVMDEHLDEAVEDVEMEEHEDLQELTRFTSHEVMGLVLLVALAVIVGTLFHRRRIFLLPESGATVLIGLAVGLAVHLGSGGRLAALEKEEALYFNPEFFTLFLLPPIIFESGFSLNQSLFFGRFATICTFAVVGTLISTALLWLLIWSLGEAGLIFHLSPVEAGAFAALISAVDPVATLATFSSLKADPELHNLVFGESVLNDAVSIVLFRSILDFYLDDFYAQMHLPRVLLSFATIATVSILVGWATAALSALVFKWLRMAHHEEGDTHLREAALFWCFSYLSFVVAEVAQLSGIVSTLFAGIFMARYVTPNLTRRGLRLCAQLYRVLALLADTMVFLLVGMAIVVYYNECEVSHTSFFLVAFVGCIGARAANIFPLARLLNHLRPRSKHKISKNFQVVMWFSGLRGAIAVALSVQMPGPRKGPIIVVTMLIVFASIFVFGGASKRLLDRLKIATGEKGTLDRELTRLSVSHRQLLAALPQAAAAAATAVGDALVDDDNPLVPEDDEDAKTEEAYARSRSRLGYRVRAFEARWVLHYVVDRTIPGHELAWSAKGKLEDDEGEAAAAPKGILRRPASEGDVAAAGASNGAASPKKSSRPTSRPTSRGPSPLQTRAAAFFGPRGNYGKLRACSDASDISAFAAEQAEREVEPATDAVADAIGEALAETAGDVPAATDL